MRMMNKPRMLRADEIEVRVAHSVGDKKCHLLYIHSRAVTKYLDEWVGWNNWQTEFYPVNNQIVGRLGIWDDIKQMWIWKSDVGSESNIEKDKGLISDTYKRLLVRFGITELYSAPDILLPEDGYGNKGYKVSEIAYNDNREIIHLVLVNRFNKEVYRWSQEQNTCQSGPYQPERHHANSGTSQMRKPQGRFQSESSAEDRLREFCDSIKDSTNNQMVSSFYNFYMQPDRDNPSISIAAKYGSMFDPQKQYNYWQNKNNKQIIN